MCLKPKVHRPWRRAHFCPRPGEAAGQPARCKGSASGLFQTARPLWKGRHLSFLAAVTVPLWSSTPAGLGGHHTVPAPAWASVIPLGKSLSVSREQAAPFPPPSLPHPPGQRRPVNVQVTFTDPSTRPPTGWGGARSVCRGGGSCLGDSKAQGRRQGFLQPGLRK